MKIAVLGVGYVGLVSGVCFAHFGIHTVCVDTDNEKLRRIGEGFLPIYEPGLGELVTACMAQGTLSFTSDLSEALASADAAFIAVGTPTKMGSETADLSYVFAAGEDIARLAQGPLVTVIKSTVPVGTAAKLRQRIASRNPHHAIEVASNPEFLREGTAVRDFLEPDRVVVGVASAHAEAVLRAVYAPLIAREVPFVCVSSESAEIIKYAANAYLALRITYVNQLADLCEASGADIGDVARGTGLDRRIGPHYFAPGPGYGGSCLPKDTRALTATAREFGSPVSLVEEAISANDHRRHHLVERLERASGGSLAGKKVAVLGLAFKAMTDDLRESPALDLVAGLQAADAVVTAYDPVAMENARRLLPGLRLAGNALDASRNAAAIAIMTEWEEFKTLDLEGLRQAANGDVLFDFRNILNPERARQAGFSYYSIGRPKPAAAG